MNLHPGKQRINHSGYRRPKEALSDLCKLAIAGLVVCLLVGVAVGVEMMGASTHHAEGTVVARQSILAGRSAVSAAEVQIQDGPYRFRMVKVSDGNRFKPGDKVVVSFYEGKLTGDLRGTKISRKVTP